MTFAPPRCPYAGCREHRSPSRRFYYRWGSYKPRCRRFRIPRFRCKACRRSFSRQTFRGDYRDRRPDANGRLLDLLSAGVGLRESGRKVGLRVYAVERKLRKFARLLDGLHANLARELPRGRTYLLDEEESYEGASIRPLTVPLVLEREAWFLVGAAVGPIRRLAPAGTARRRRQEADERRRGRRRDESRQRVAEVLRALDARAPDGPLLIQTDRKASYPGLIRGVLGPRARHETTSGKARRTTANPLFPINVTIAMTRDNCGRLRRRSWLVSKTAAGLRAQLSVFTAYRNYVRVRFNRDQSWRSSAQVLGLAPRALTWPEAVRWRQDWGTESLSPLCLRGRRTVGQLSASGP